MLVIHLKKAQYVNREVCACDLCLLMAQGYAFLQAMPFCGDDFGPVAPFLTVTGSH